MKKSIGYYLGQVFAAILIGCAVICLSAIVVAITLKFLTLIF